MFRWLFGKSTKKSTKSTKKAAKNTKNTINKNIIKMCKKYKVRLTIKKNNKRIYKSESVLRTQCNNKKKRLLKKHNNFGALTNNPRFAQQLADDCKKGFTPDNLIPIPYRASDFDTIAQRNQQNSIPQIKQ